MERLGTLFKDFPYEDHTEGMYRAVTYLICRLCDTEPQAERHSFKGRSDLEVQTADYVYLFEFKYDESAEAALAQIRDRDYAGRLRLDARKVYLIGVNYSGARETRGLSWLIEPLA